MLPVVETAADDDDEDQDQDEDEDENEELNFVGLEENIGGKVPKIGEFWRVGNREGNYRFVLIEMVEVDILGVKFFKASPKETGNYTIIEKFWTILHKELDKKVAPPKVF